MWGDGSIFIRPQLLSFYAVFLLVDLVIEFYNFTKDPALEFVAGDCLSRLAI